MNCPADASPSWGWGVLAVAQAWCGFLTSRGARVTVTDVLDRDELADSLAQIADCPVETFRLGGHVEDDLIDADLVVVNPAVPPTNPFLARAREYGVPLTSEMSLFWQFHPGRTLAVTGSNGKSTTTAMTHAILQAAGVPSRLGGNIGKSLLPDVDQITPEEWAVLELSSFQLEDLGPVAGQSERGGRHEFQSQSSRLARLPLGLSAGEADDFALANAGRRGRSQPG